MEIREFRTLNRGDEVRFERRARGENVLAQGRIAGTFHGEIIPVLLTEILDCNLFISHLYKEGTHVLATPNELTKSGGSDGKIGSL